MSATNFKSNITIDGTIIATPTSYSSGGYLFLIKNSTTNKFETVPTSIIPTVNNATLTLATSGIATGSATFTANSSTDTTFTVNVPSTLSSYTNDAGFTTNTGTVISVGLSLPSLFSVSNSPITTSGTLTATLSNQSANTWFGNSGTAAAVPTFNSAAALTATNDTNVTITLGGTPSASLLKAASITLGWTGSLSYSRGGTGLSTLGTAGQLIGVNSAGTALEYKTVSVPTSSDYVTTNTTQTGLSGDKTWTGVHTFTDKSVSNFNTPVGNRFISSSSATVTNQPITGDYGVGIQFSTNNDSNYINQLVADWGETGTNWWVRNKFNATWGSWYRLWHSGDFTSTNISNWNTAFANMHDPVTIGTANGLSLSSQSLSLALSSTSTVGALSSTDWNTFNNKAPATGGTGYIQNQTSSTQSAGFNIDGSGKLDKLVVSSGVYSTTSNKFQVASFFIQPYAVNNTFLTQNLTYNGGWQTATTGYASGFQLVSGGISFIGAPSTTASTVFTPIYMMKMRYDGTVGLGGTSMNSTSGDYTGASFVANSSYVYSNKNFGIGNTAPSYSLDVTGSARITGLSGTGNRMVITDANGLLSTQDIPSATGTVTSITPGNGFSSNTAITTSGTITLGTPTAITLSSTNSVTTNSHTHAFTPGGTTSQYITGAGTLVTFPTIPTVNNATLTLATAGIATGSATFTANSSTATTFTVSVPQQWEDLTQNGYNYQGNGQGGRGIHTGGGYASRSQILSNGNNIIDIDVEHLYAYNTTAVASVELPDPAEFPERVLNISNNSSYNIQLIGTYQPLLNASTPLTALTQMSGTSVDTITAVTIKSVDDGNGDYLWLVVQKSN